MQAVAILKPNSMSAATMSTVSVVILLILTAVLILVPMSFNSYYIMADASSLPPWFAFTLGFKAFRLIELFPNWVMPAPVRMVDLAITGLQKSQVIVAVNTLGVADALGDSEQTAHQLASQLNIPDADKLNRLLAAAAAFGVFSVQQASEESELMFSNNGLSAVLRQGHPNTVTHTIKGGMQSLYVPWGKIAEGLQQNKMPFELVHGKNMWEFLAEHPDMEHEFSLAMTSQDTMGIHAVLTDFSWTKYSRVIDVGAAYGSFLADIMDQRENSKLAGTVCDLPQVVARAKEQWQMKHAGLLDRTRFESCDFLTAGKLPSPEQHHEAYVLRDILHDWSDDEAITILKNIRRAIGSDSSARLLLVEAALHSKVAGLEPSVRYLLDINMLVGVDGKERTANEFSDLFGQTGFKLKAVHATRGLYKVIEAVPMKHNVIP